MSDILSPAMKATVVDRYAVDLEPFIAEKTFRGSVRMSVTTSSPLSRIELHAVDIEVSSAVADGFEVRELVRADPATIVVVLDRPALGAFELSLEFSGLLSDKLAGFYPSRLGDAMCAVTQFEERDARRAFPCIDHPGRKSVFDVSLVAAEGMIAVSNTALSAIDELEGGRKRFRFVPTPPMSTYLLFFGVGPFGIIEDRSSRVTVRVVGAKRNVETGRISFGFAREALDYFEEYTGVAYPLDKLDLIGVADFAYGAMENFGAITYRENYVYYDESTASQEDIQTMASITAHEIAHMWFGDLVTPTDWGYVWLNEAFATYFGTVVVERYHPQWHLLEQWLAGSKGGTMERDSLPGTVPIEFAEGAFTEIDPSTAPIIYGKAGAVLHMVRDFVGDEVFRRGVNRYLTKYSFACAATDDFLAAFAEAVGNEVSALMERWIRQPGFPVVTAERRGDTLELTQKRFVLGASSDETLWPVPVTVLALGESGRTERITKRFDSRTTTLELPRGTVACKLNAGEAGFYRAHYSGSMRDALADTFGSWSPVDRAGIVADLHATLIEGSVALGAALDFVERIVDGEDDERPLRSIASLLLGVIDLVPTAASRATGLLERLLEPTWRRLGAQPRSTDDPVDSRLRPDVLWWLYRAGHAEARSAAIALARRAAALEPVGGDLIAPALRVAAAELIVDRAWLSTAVEDPEVSESRRRTLLSAMGWFSDERDLDAILDYSTAKVAPQNLHYVIGSIVANRKSRSLLAGWLDRSVDRFVQFPRFSFERIVSTAIPVAGIGRADEVRALTERKLKPIGSAGPLDMALERMDALDRFVSRCAGEPKA
jgi:aminopeptidase N